MKIGERIRFLRKELGLTQAEFGQRVRISQSGLAANERGDRGVDDRMIMLICSEFGVSETWLRTGVGEMYEKKPAADDLIGRLASEYKMSATEISFLEAYLQLPPDKRAVLEELVDRAYELRAERINSARRELVDSLHAEAARESDPPQTSIL